MRVEQGVWLAGWCERERRVEVEARSSDFLEFKAAQSWTDYDWGTIWRAVWEVLLRDEGFVWISFGTVQSLGGIGA